MEEGQDGVRKCLALTHGGHRPTIGTICCVYSHSSRRTRSPATGRYSTALTERRLCSWRLCSWQGKVRYENSAPPPHGLMTGLRLIIDALSGTHNFPFMLPFFLWTTILFSHFRRTTTTMISLSPLKLVTAMSCPTLSTTPIIPAGRGPFTLVRCIGLFVSKGSFPVTTVVDTPKTVLDLAAADISTESPIPLEIDVDIQADTLVPAIRDVIPAALADEHSVTPSVDTPLPLRVVCV